MEFHMVFMGSPDFAVPILKQLASRYEVIGVVTQPDRPAGRGQVLTPPPIKLLAQEIGLSLIQPKRLSDPEAVQQIIDWAPDLIVVAAFGQILRQAILELPEFGCINVHASLLPRWRGAAPVQAAILNGDDLTGITIMRMDPGIDTGPILRQESLPITNQDTSITLANKLSKLGADLLLETLPDYISGGLVPKPQEDALATYAPMIKKDQGKLDFFKPAIELDRKIRAYNPWPGAYCYLKGQLLKIYLAHPVISEAGKPGKRIIYQSMPAVTTGDGILVLDLLQLAGRKVQNGNDFLQGIRIWESSEDEL